MYNYPYGDNQQINLNWIISEIIALHQRLDPDYTAPTFTQIYPFSDTQQLNLDWILTELKALKDLAPTPPPTEEIDKIGQALIAGAYDATTSYQKNDYIVQDGKLYRANAATTGTFDPTKWREVMLGDDLAINTRWADTTNTYLNNLAASNVSNDSTVAGDTVKDALGNLNGALKGVANKHKYVFISDSYGVGITAGGTTDGLAVLIQQGLGLSSTEFYQNCVGGSGFIGTVTDTFITQLASVAASIPDANKPEITDVIFCGGYNDRMRTASALNTAIQTAATNARTFFTNAKLWIVMAGFSTDVNGTSRSKLQDLQQIYSTYGQQNGMAFIGANMALKMHRSLMSSDTVHPSSGGYIVQAGYIMTVLLGGIPLQYYGGNVATLSKVENETAPKYTSLTQRFNNNQIVTIYPSNLDTFDIENRSTKPGNMAWYKLANISNELGQGFGNSDSGADWGSGQVDCILRFSSGGNATYKEAKGIVSINHGGLFIKLTNVEGGAWMSYTNVTHISIKACSTYIPVEAVC